MGGNQSAVQIPDKFICSCGTECKVPAEAYEWFCNQSTCAQLKLRNSKESKNCEVCNTTRTKDVVYQNQARCFVCHKVNTLPALPFGKPLVPILASSHPAVQPEPARLQASPQPAQPPVHQPVLPVLAQPYVQPPSAQNAWQQLPAPLEARPVYAQPVAALQQPLENLEGKHNLQDTLHNMDAREVEHLQRLQDEEIQLQQLHQKRLDALSAPVTPTPYVQPAPQMPISAPQPYIQPTPKPYVQPTPAGAALQPHAQAAPYIQPTPTPQPYIQPTPTPQPAVQPQAAALPYTQVLAPMPAPVPAPAAQPDVPSLHQQLPAVLPIISAEDDQLAAALKASALEFHMASSRPASAPAPVPAPAPTPNPSAAFHDAIVNNLINPTPGPAPALTPTPTPAPAHAPTPAPAPAPTPVAPVTYESKAEEAPEAVASVASSDGSEFVLVKDEFEYKEELDQLEKLGFANRAFNLSLLRFKQGRLLAVIAFLTA